MWHDRQFPRTLKDDDARSPYDVDYARIIHSASFRRLQGKTQILNLGDSDFYRTRLTHSLEVAQIGSSIVRQLKKFHQDADFANVLPDINLIQSVCLTHDLGHPPFGHGGEVALNYCMRESGGFEANGQSLRILTKIGKFSEGRGANFTRRTLLGILKYPVSYGIASSPDLVPRLADMSVIRVLDRSISKPPKCYYDSEQDVVGWLLSKLSQEDQDLFLTTTEPAPQKHRKAIHNSLDCSIMNIADDIAYGVHDLGNL